MKCEPHKNENKSLSIKNLLRIAKEAFSQIHSERDPKEISTSDCLMSALAVFSLKSPSLLAFDKQRQEETVQHNLQTLFSIKNIPCDTYMRPSTRSKTRDTNSSIILGTEERIFIPCLLS